MTALRHLIAQNSSYPECLANLPLFEPDKPVSLTPFSEPRKLTPQKSYKLIDNFTGLEEAVEELSTAPVLGIDTETTGLDPHCDQLRLIQLAATDFPVVLVDVFKIPLRRKMWALLTKFFDSTAIKVFHNAKFDLKFFTKVGLKIKGQLFDTQIAHQLLTAGLKEKASLKVIAHKYLGVELEKESQQSDWSVKELTEEQLSYAALDARILLDLRNVLRLKLKQADLVQTAVIEFGAIPAVAQMEYQGMFLDLSKWEIQVREMAIARQKAAEELQTLLVSDNPQMTIVEGANRINLNSHQQLLKAIQAQGVPIQSTNKNHIAPLASKYPVLAALQKYRKSSKSLSAFGNALPTHVSPHTQRIHSSIWQLGAVSGRFSFSHPNLQQVPRKFEIRRCFTAAPGNKLIIADYSQIELRIAAEISGDWTMINAYQTGQDLHRLTASLVLGKPLDEVVKSDRQMAKPINFGLIYGMFPPRLQNYASVEYGVEMTLRDAKIFRLKFFESYRGLAQWHQRVNNALYSNKTWETRTLAKRRRQWLPDKNPSLNEMLNLPVQGTSADITKLALAQLLFELEGTAAVIIAVVHDEIILECPESNALQASEILKRVMIQAGRKFLNRVPVEVEVAIADNWAEK
ncbi:bifunctional 3'-5' exonuclease/DNA polymerase [Aetokthonos hydrillicola Thurmond2011]|jgi:DNA polymerase-1|uniref:DNA polymerase I n=1 Tax=Aetokthonos hydrillicola Thurmond2011 TaxID=2712845 RepID=A0AAP5IEP9_9CYAN|nr:bifunctional 3'-5' exonuclease/DNA polymerase [Aetokthonos hydrillicola]MBO3463268.1 bifunctional 3'-5' exonuclease/DNA polymerase [Aetokthonos hydrillicola CCALA 1050]MBW4590507.1 bifunctional 3'-5' exonuclease/DNA polymerase [Aetokthonos hydrillicola CCALA 1050]MDR9899019.1 bifunctional 3'-5' exonuclease/DNA polymerase [Aetokthonos hydrillicola Thurmond2011]